MDNKPIRQTIMSVKDFNDACVRGVKEFCIKRKITDKDDYHFDSTIWIDKCWGKYGKYIVNDIIKDKYGENSPIVNSIANAFKDYYFNPEHLADLAIFSIQFIPDDVTTYEDWICSVVSIPIALYDINKMLDQAKYNKAFIKA
mgnify:CR=1 FL=1